MPLPDPAPPPPGAPRTGGPRAGPRGLGLGGGVFDLPPPPPPEMLKCEAKLCPLIQ